MKIDFVKNTLFKKIIQARSEEGVLLTIQKWQEYAENNGNLRRKQAANINENNKKINESK